MAKFWTWSEIKAKVQRDLDIQDEKFVTAAELLEYANEAIDDAESEIHTLYEDYFLATTTLNLTSGSDEIDLPTNIYAHKIRRILYSVGNNVYNVARLQDWQKFEKKEVADLDNSQGDWSYFLVNNTAGSPKILITPVPTATENGALKIYYLRNANRLAVDADVCDIPEFINFIFQYMKVRVYEKEMHPNLSAAMAALQHYREQMQGTLANMVPDGEDEIETDMRVYDDMN